MTHLSSLRIAGKNSWWQFLIACLLLGLANPVTAAPAFLEQTNLFEAGEAGVALYRIPGIVVTTNGSVLVYCEARKNSKSDWGDIDVYLRRSTNGGRTFEVAHKIAHNAEKLARSPLALAHSQGRTNEQTVNNPVAIVDQKTGAVHFLYCVNYERCFYMRSDDDGVTFSKPVEITTTFDSFRPEYDCHIMATGPGHGIQLKNGRLVVPVWISTGVKGHAPSVSATIYSDDHGKTWKRGAIALPSTEDWPSPNETIAAQLADGSVMLNVRTGTKANRKVVTTSPDGATNWTKGHFDEQLLEPICMASLERYSLTPSSDKNRLLFSNPDNLKGGKDGEAPGTHRARKNLSIKLSYDEGQTWPVNKVLEKGNSAYSDLAVMKDGTILCLYESYQNLTLARFNLEWLTDGKDSGLP